MGDSNTDNRDDCLSRRTFLRVGGAVAAGGALASMPVLHAEEKVEKEESKDTGDGKPKSKIKKHRTLGRTGFKVSDVSAGGLYDDGNVVRYLYDSGVNYFDTAESYGNGDSERRIGEAMPHMDRKKIFITTKLQIEEKDTEETILERYGKCLERLKTDYADALYIHSVTNLDLLKNEAYHAAVKRLKTDGRVKHTGVSSHGPRGQEGDSMEKVLVAAAEDGRFDLMLLTYNYLNKDEAEKVLAACKKNNVGTTAMKTAPAMLEMPPFDPDNPVGDYKDWMKYLAESGATREEAIKRIEAYIERQKEPLEQSKPFIEKYGPKTNEELRRMAAKWVLGNDDMHTVCLRMQNFDMVDDLVALSGTSLSRADAGMLRDWAAAFGTEYCRHGCVECAPACPANVPVSTIMRYSYYFHAQGREKYAMGKYAALEGPKVAACLNCSGPCMSVCPHNVNVQAHLMQAHSLLSFA